MTQFHHKPLQDVMNELDARSAGLSAGQVAVREKRFGKNKLYSAPPPKLVVRILAQLKDPMIVVLLAAAALSLFASGGAEWFDATIILIIVTLNAAISISQEDHAQRALQALEKMAAPMAHVMRTGQQVRIPAEDLVPGDIIMLKAGDYVPADARIMESASLRCDESALTGESMPVEKKAGDDLLLSAPVGDWHNMVLSGTNVVGGNAVAVVVATGMDTQMGNIAQLLLEEQDLKTPLQIKMAEISKTLSFICLCVCAVMFGVGLLQGRYIFDMFMMAVSLAVAAIPEGLAAVVTIVLSMGVGRMAQRGAIIKKLSAVETLGGASVICSDKTGTLTENKMAVQKLWTANSQSRRDAFVCAVLCNDARLVWENGLPVSQGEPTEGALLLSAAKEGMERVRLEKEYPRLAQLPFDSQNKYMITIHPCEEGGYWVMVKGAPDVLLDRCSFLAQTDLTITGRQKIMQENEQMAQDALRVIAVAHRRVPRMPTQNEITTGTVAKGLTFLGLFGLSDPPRKQAEKAVIQCHKAGVRPIMITGDHKITAVSIAEKLHIFRDGDYAITGAELDFMPQSMLEEDIEKFSVYARVSPEHKMRIVQAWQKKGKVVAMTGDGVNDAPALKAAQIGCAMGITGTDVAKGAAEMILTDDNFSTIVAAIEEGRGIYENIRKAIHYLLSCNIGEVVVIFTATVLNFSYMPLLPIQLLWLNLVTDTFPALALGVEPVAKDCMEKPPRDANASLFDRGFSLRLLWQGLMVGLLTLAAFCFGFGTATGQQEQGAVANTMAFATLTLSQLFHAFNVRSEDASIFSIGLFRNRAMNRAFLFGFTLQMAVLLVPVLQGVFGVVNLLKSQWIVVFILATLPIPICEMTKALAAQRVKHAPSSRQSTAQTETKIHAMK